jgi:quercetin dioxygenase-like cupin family protein
LEDCSSTFENRHTASCDHPHRIRHMRVERKWWAVSGTWTLLQATVSELGRRRNPAKPKRSDEMEIKRSGSQPSGKGPENYFTGTVRIDPLFDAPDPARVLGASVTFEPGARTAWHTHPLGQTLIVTAGCGWAQRWGGPVEEIRPGDVIWFPPGEKHWHGATATTAMTHIAIQEKLDGKAVDWMEQVTEKQYQVGKTNQ